MKQHQEDNGRLKRACAVLAEEALTAWHKTYGEPTTASKSGSKRMLGRKRRPGASSRKAAVSKKTATSSNAVVSFAARSKSKSKAKLKAKKEGVASEC